ncbi:MAG TPA: sialate O-acetylesterase, partial [Tepidisphaeraceae bacterium]
PAEAWTSREAMEADPDLKVIVQRWDHWTAAYPHAKELYEQKMKEWKAAADKAKTDGKPIPTEPAQPANPEFMHRAAALYNGMLAPLMPFAIRGVIWYQGETNSGRADQYRKLFPALIRDWRGHWGQGNFPFIYVQIAPMDAGPVDRAELRDAQREALSLPNTAMIVTLDIGEAKDEHPHNKKEVGHRLALAAEKLAYAQDVVYSGPLYQGMKVEGNAIRLSFEHVDGGLVARGGSLKGFTIAGEDKKFVAADAKIDGKSVLVSSAKVDKPVAVRYCFVNWPGDENVTLFNTAGLPASSFRTDDWPLTTKGETRMFFDQMGLDDVTLTPKK